MQYDIDRLNRQLDADGQITYVRGPGDLVIAEIANEAASASVSLYGGHVLSYRRHEGQPVLWLSGKSWYEIGKPIRGGIPVCWPWFGAHPTDPSLPGHGLARIHCWEVLEAAAPAPGVTVLTLGLRNSPETLNLWPFPFSLRLRVTVGSTLRLDLTTENPGHRAITLTQALHTYFAISDIARIRVEGFDGCPFIDTVGGANRIGTQQGDITFSEETDLVLLECPGDACVVDPGLGRRIRIAKEGSRSGVVWNPWIAKSARMPDFGDNEYPGMVCVETTNAPGDEAVIDPGQSTTLTAIILTDDLVSARGD